MSETYYDLPIPQDLESVRSVNDGSRWLHGVIPGSVTLDNGILTFDVSWNRGQARRRFTMAIDVVAGFECDA